MPKTWFVCSSPIAGHLAHDAGEARNSSPGLFAGLEGPYALLRKGRSQLPVPKAHKPFAAESARGEELEHLAHYEYLASNV
jgi:hypothetical protein